MLDVISILIGMLLGYIFKDYIGIFAKILKRKIESYPEKDILLFKTIEEEIKEPKVLIPKKQTNFNKTIKKSQNEKKNNRQATFSKNPFSPKINYYKKNIWYTSDGSV